MIWILFIIILVSIYLYTKRKKPVAENIQEEEKKTNILLAVPYQKAKGKDWCLPASGAMVFKYYGGEISQRGIASKIIKNKKASVPKFMVYAKEEGYPTEWKRIPIEEIEELLREDIPLIVIQKYSLQNKASHCRVIIGFNSEKAELTLHDPAGKRSYRMSYKTFHSLGMNTTKKERIIIIRR